MSEKNPQQNAAPATELAQAEPMDAISEAKAKYAKRFSTRVKVDPKSPIGYPKPVKKGSNEETLVKNWKAQKRAFCQDPRCYYPLNPKLLEEESFELLRVESPSGDKLVVGECSYDPRHAGGVQLYAPVKRDGTED